MTEPEGPDTLGSLFGGLRDEDSSSPAALSVYPTRRSMRDAELEPAPTDRPSRAERRSLARAERTAARAARRGSSAARRTVRRPIRERLSAAGVMLVIGGLFAALGLPAYAEGPEVTTPLPIADSAAQSFVASDVVAEAQVERDSYGATSAANLIAQYRNQISEANLAAYLRSGAREQGDDYPWPAALHLGQGGGLSPLRYYYRECVDFVAWRLNRDAGVTKAPWKWDWGTLTPGGGSAISWKYQWDRNGWQTSSKPAPGFVAWFGGANHVAYVTAVNGDGTILIEEYNWGGNHMYNKRTIPASSVTLFLVPPG